MFSISSCAELNAGHYFLWSKHLNHNQSHSFEAVYEGTRRGQTTGQHENDSLIETGSEHYGCLPLTPKGKEVSYDFDRVRSESAIQLRVYSS